MKVNHFVIAVENLEKSLELYKKMGFVPCGQIVEDNSRNVKIIFIKNQQDYCLELIQNMDESKPSGAKSALLNHKTKSKHSIYHICYETTDIEKAADELKANNIMMIANPEKAIAFNNRKVAFFVSPAIGMIELVENK